MALGLMSNGVIATLDVNLLANGCLIDIEAIAKSCPSINIAHGGYNVSVEPSTICITPTVPSTVSYVTVLPSPSSTTSFTPVLYETTVLPPAVSSTTTCTEMWQTSITTTVSLPQSPPSEYPYCPGCPALSSSSSGPSSLPSSNGGSTSTISMTPSTFPAQPTISYYYPPIGPSSPTGPVMPPVLPETTSSQMSTTSSAPVVPATTNAQVTPTTSPPDATCTSCQDHPAPYCTEPLISIDIMALGITIDLEVYLDLAGLLKGVVDTVGNLVGGLFGGRPKPKPTLPKQVLHQYKPKCGTSYADHPGGKTCSATDYHDCLSQCEKDAIQLTAAVGDLRDCLGVTVHHGLEINNCLYFLGSDSDILDIDVKINSRDEASDSFVRTGA